MNYFEIGQRIRKVRKAHGMSQDELSERVGISVTHMSHIETGNTKLSLPVLVQIAEVLEVRTDDLLFDGRATVHTAAEDIEAVLQRCTAQEAQVISDVVKAVKASIDRHIRE